MAKIKTTETGKSVIDFIHEFANTDQKIKDSYDLIELMQKVTGYPPKMWGPSIIGFGRYHYKYESGHEGDMAMIGFSPRKAAISLYVSTGVDNQDHLLMELGTFKMGKSCIYIKRLSDINQKALIALIKDTLKYIKKTYPE